MLVMGSYKGEDKSWRIIGNEIGDRIMRWKRGTCKREEGEEAIVTHIALSSPSFTPSTYSLLSLD